MSSKYSSSIPRLSDKFQTLLDESSPATKGLKDHFEDLVKGCSIDIDSELDDEGEAALSQQDAVGSVRIDVDGMQLRLSKPMPEGKYSLYTAPPSTAQEGTVYVCPLKDSECGNKSTWCEACPQRKPTAQGVDTHKTENMSDKQSCESKVSDKVQGAEPVAHIWPNDLEYLLGDKLGYSAKSALVSSCPVGVLNSKTKTIPLFLSSPPLEDGMVRVPVETAKLMVSAASVGLRHARAKNQPESLVWTNAIADTKDAIKAASKGEP